MLINPYVFGGYTPTDAAADAYIAAVEVADGTVLEAGVKKVIDEFVIGCKADGIWASIKASCILAGARTLAGALVPLVGAAPTNFNFVSADYNRKTGLLGNGSTKYLNSNRNNNADPQNSNHNAIYVSSAATKISAYIAASSSLTSTGDNNFGVSNASTGQLFFRNRTGATPANRTPSGASASGFIGVSRTVSSQHVSRMQGTNATATQASSTPFNGNLFIYAGAGGSSASDCRLAFYSIGEALDLALLDARVTTLINALGAAIP